MIALRLRLPVLVGYILAGVLIGPNTPGLDADRDRILLLANLGVAFLMFALGVEFSLNELLQVRRIALVAGAIQLPLTIALGAGVGLLVGWSLAASLLLGGAFAISSSIVAIKLLLGRGEVESPHATVALGLGIVQDLSLVLMLAFLPVMAGEGDDLGPALVRSVITAAVALLIVLVVGVRVVPRLLFIVARTGSRELFLLTIVLIALGTALAAHEAGLSFALGAFLAGIVVSESEFDSQVLAEIIPLRDLFATLFFVAVGMLLDPDFVIHHAGTVVLLIAALVVGKLIITGGAYLAAGVDHRTATLAAILLAQMGEFSFVLASVGLEDHVIDDDQYALILAAALGSILLVPALLAASPTLVALAAAMPGVSAQERIQVGTEPAHNEPGRHVVICGYGRVGRELGEALRRRGFGYTVIDLNPAIVRELRAQGIPAYYGDSGSEALLRRAGVPRARTIAIATPDLVASRATIRHAREMNPDIRVVARAPSGDEGESLSGTGADEVVQPEFEAGMEFVRRVLRWQGVSLQETTALLARRRTAFYEPGRSVSPTDER
ncbi:MAG: monovalent cation:H+ antiporter-2, family [Thermomicrobiales bacterium]|jgi:CPA2 family monovalent cation:H+ antiporter-2|nr:monovalent cation:H+ antiporter-2, family [Thermomicrobiales bacterium]